jgi:precorrin-6B C5,15-methyltransferase / cobalt-precorrin-6B C5,C15-methyltransferase
MGSTGPSHLVVVGIGADGWQGMPEPHRRLILDAPVLWGGARHLGLVPEVPGQQRSTWPKPLSDGLPALLASVEGEKVTVLASGDPLVSGIGRTLVDLLGPERVTIEPSVSSVALARARMRWAADSAAVVSLVGRDVHLVLREVAPGRRILVLSADASTPANVARLLTEHGSGASRLTVLGDLGAADESRTSGTASGWAGESPRLNVVAIEVDGPGWSWSAGLPDMAYEHDGQLTKRDVRASALAHLAPQPGELLWDVGAGAGSVGIEWMRVHPTCRTVAIEADATRADRIRRNAANLGVPGIEVVHGSAPDALIGLPAPDAVFVGGGARADLLDLCLKSLRVGGRLVVHAVTAETETLLVEMRERYGGELLRLRLEHLEPLGGYHGWTPARAITQWAMELS